MRVLFELWAPGSDEVSLTWVLCRECGFVGYLPRATPQEIDQKYRFLAEVETTPEARSEIRPLDRARSEEIATTLAKLLPRTGVLLDFGGGNGALTSRFLDLGFECGVVDYTTATVPGVARWGDTLDDLEEGRAFDVIVCSHVFEHLADPVSVARRLKGLMRPEGLLFIEAPLEIRGGPPALVEPVTHVNFFCQSSLGTVLRRAGFELLELRTEKATFASGASRWAVRAVGRPGPPGEVSFELPGSAEARRLLRPGVSGTLARALSRLRS